MTLKVVLIAHRHPEESFGGAEGAAFNLFEKLQGYGCETRFIGASMKSPHAGVSGRILEQLSAGNFRLGETAPDSVLLDGSPSEAALLAFANFLENEQPDIVHFHHCLRFGLEGIQLAARYRETARKPVALIYTLHEYLLICAADGQLLRLRGQNLCRRHNMADCIDCMRVRNVTAAQLALRDARIACMTKLFDSMISPSQFLLKAMRPHIDLPPNEVIENICGTLETGKVLLEFEAGVSRLKLGFFGRITRLKGALVPLRALALLPDALKARVELHYFGEIAEDPSLKAEIASLVRGVENVHFHGRYSAAEAPMIMAGMHAVMVPSIWFENAPLVIREAFNAHRPILCSGIGGMAEKVTHGENGLHFKFGSEHDLAEKIQMLDRPGVWQSLQSGARPQYATDTICKAHIAHYRRSLAARMRGALT